MSSGYPDYEGGKQRVYLVPDWAAKDAVDKSFRAIGIGSAYGVTTTVGYVVPAGKTLYITDLSIVGFAAAPADAELNQIVEGSVTELLGAGILFNLSGNAGQRHAFAKPLVLRGGFGARFSVTAYGNHNITTIVYAAGYEV